MVKMLAEHLSTYISIYLHYISLKNEVKNNQQGISKYNTKPADKNKIKDTKENTKIATKAQCSYQRHLLETGCVIQPGQKVKNEQIYKSLTLHSFLFIKCKTVVACSVQRTSYTASSVDRKSVV